MVIPPIIYEFPARSLANFHERVLFDLLEEASFPRNGTSELEIA